MSHEFESGFFAKESAWHGLGSNVDQNLSWSDALGAAGLDWEVGLRPLFAQVGADQFREAFGHVGIVRLADDRILGVAGSRYTVIQNRQAFGVFESLFGSKAVLNTAGALKGGAVVFGLAELEPATIGTDEHRRFLLATTTHDGSGCLRVLPTCVRVVCWNTLSVALGDKTSGITVRHTASAPAAIARKTDELAESLGFFDRYAESASLLLGTGLTEGDQVDLCREFSVCRPWAKAAKEAFVLDSPAAEILRLANYGVGNDAIGGTAWGLLQGVTDYIDNVRPIRGGKESRFAYQTLGAGAAHKTQAFRVLDAYARRAA